MRGDRPAVFVLADAAVRDTRGADEGALPGAAPRDHYRRLPAGRGLRLPRGGLSPARTAPGKAPLV